MVKLEDRERIVAEVEIEVAVVVELVVPNLTVAVDGPAVGNSHVQHQSLDFEEQVDTDTKIKSQS